MSPVVFALGGLMVVSLIGLLFVLVGLRFSSTSEETRRLAQYVANPLAVQDSRPDPLSFRRAELEGSFQRRLLLPWFRRLGGLLGVFTPTRSMDRLRRQLAIAGHPLGLGPREFYGLQLIFIVLAFWLAYTLIAPVL